MFYSAIDRKCGMIVRREIDQNVKVGLKPHKKSIANAWACKPPYSSPPKQALLMNVFVGILGARHIDNDTVLHLTVVISALWDARCENRNDFRQKSWPEYKNCHEPTKSRSQTLESKLTHRTTFQAFLDVRFRMSGPPGANSTFAIHIFRRLVKVFVRVWYRNV